MLLFVLRIYRCAASSERSVIDSLPYPNLDRWSVLSVGGVGPAGLLGTLGRVALVNRPGVQQSGPTVELELLGRTREK